MAISPFPRLAGMAVSSYDGVQVGSRDRESMWSGAGASVKRVEERVFMGCVGRLYTKARRVCRVMECTQIDRVGVEE